MDQEEFNYSTSDDEEEDDMSDEDFNVTDSDDDEEIDELGDLYYLGHAVGLLLEDIDEEYLKILTDTTSMQARRGRDIQGIPWNFAVIARESYRKNRVRIYANLEDVPSSGKATDKEFKQTEKGGKYYEFYLNTRMVKPACRHIQMRNLIWATSKHDVYLMSKHEIVHWSLLSQKPSTILNYSSHVAPAEEHPGSLLEGFTNTEISTLAVKENLLVAGGIRGELICKYLDRRGVSFCTWLTHDRDSAINAIDIYDSLSGGIHFMASTNDCDVQEFDEGRFQLLNHFRFPWPVNHTSMSPDRKLITVVGDHPTGLLVDSQSGKAVYTLVGHLDYSFASAWHPNGRIFATGNQDKTCRLWDIRNLSSPISVLKGNIGCIRSIRFSSDGDFMAVAEPADFVHIYSTKSDYKMRQEIDFFGEITGISLSPDDETLFIGVWDRSHASLLHYNRKHAYGYLDSFV